MIEQSGPIVVTAPTLYPVTLAEAQSWCRVSGSLDDAKLNDCIIAATDYFQRRTGKQLLTATLKQLWDEFEYSEGCLKLDRGPVASITSVKYYDVDGNQQTIASTNYWPALNRRPPEIWPKWSYAWPQSEYGRPEAVEVIYVAGVAAVSSLPASILIAIRELVMHWYSNPAAAITTGGVPQPLPHALDELIAMHAETFYG